MAPVASVYSEFALPIVYVIGMYFKGKIGA